MIRAEVELVLHEKERATQARENILSEEQVSDLTKKIVRIVEQQNGLPSGSSDIQAIIQKILDSQNEAEVEDEYSFLTEAEVKILENLVSSPYVNPFVALDEKRDRLNLERAELPRRRHKNYGLWALFSRPTFRFVKSYIIKKGFLDGKPGLIHALLDGYYQFIIVSKLMEERKK